MKFTRFHRFFFLFVCSVILRLLFSFSMELIPGMNGGYYPVQVRAILESGQLGFPDFPLYFYVLAFIAKLGSLLGFELSGDVLMGIIKVVEAIALPLLLWPMYKMAYKTKPSVEMILGIFLLFGSGPMMMFGDFQKNAFALPFLYFFIWKFRDYLIHAQGSDLLKSLIFLLVVGLTHFGAFAVGVLFLGIGFAFRFQWKAIVPMVVSLFFLAGISYVFDPKRSMRLMESVLSIFLRNDGKGPGGFFISPPDIVSMVLMILLIVAAFRHRKKIAVSVRKVFIYALLATSILLSFPVFGQDFYMRLGLMAGMFQVLLLLEFWDDMKIWYSRIILGLMLVIVLAGIPMAMFMKQPMISTKQRDQLLEISEKMNAVSGSKIIVTRHGVEWWTNWFTRIPVVQDRAMRNEIFAQYDHVYFLEMKSSMTGPPHFSPEKMQNNDGILDTVYRSEVLWLVEWNLIKP